MSRINASILWHLFKKDPASKKPKCTLCGDLYSYKTTTGNLKCHLRKRHIDAYERVASCQYAPLISQACSSAPSQACSSAPTGEQNVRVPINATDPGIVPSATQQLQLPRPAQVPRPAPQQQRIENYGTARKISAD